MVAHDLLSAIGKWSIACKKQVTEIDCEMQANQSMRSNRNGGHAQACIRTRADQYQES